MLFMFPVPPSKDSPGVQTLLQGFSWSEATRQDDLAQRNALLALHVKVIPVQPCTSVLRRIVHTRSYCF